jgi:nucleoside-diphosphate-sugar epimerase
MKALVVGASGFIGRHLCAGLAARRHQVLALSSRDGSGIDAATGLFPSTFSLPQGLSTVYYLAQSPRFREGAAAAGHLLAVNVVSAVNCAVLAAQAGATSFIYASTGNVYAPSHAPLSERSPVARTDWYALSKLQAEEALMLLADRIQISVLRFFGVYGPGQTGRLVPNLIDSVHSGRVIELEASVADTEDADGLRLSLCYVDDAVALLARAADGSMPALLNVAGDEALSIRAIATEIGRQLGREPVLTKVERARRGDLVADTALLAHTLPVRFKTFAEGLRATLEARVQSQL